MHYLEGEFPRDESVFGYSFGEENDATRYREQILYLYKNIGLHQINRFDYLLVVNQFLEVLKSDYQ